MNSKNIENIGESIPMAKIKIGFLTIGQSPRTDIMTDIQYLILPNIEIIEMGLLDNLSSEEIENLKPEEDEFPFVSRLRDGSQAFLSDKKIQELLPPAIDLMITDLDVRAVAMLCTHDFPKMTFSCPIIFPNDYLKFLVNHILKTESLGVVIPLESQIEMTRKKWKSKRIVLEVKSPYIERHHWDTTAKRFIDEKVDAVVLDCIGFNIPDGRELQHLLNIPILLPRTILAFAINQLYYYSI